MSLIAALLLAYGVPAAAPAPVVTVLQVWYKPWQSGLAASLTTGSNPCTVTAGATLVAGSAGWDATRQIPLLGDSAGSFTTPSDAGSVSSISHPNQMTVGISTQVNATGGSHTITCPTINDGSGGTNGELEIWLVQVTNMPSTLKVRDATSNHNTRSTKTWSWTSDTTPVVGDLVFAMGTYENSAASVSGGLSNDSAHGFTQIGINNDATSFIPTWFGYKIATAASTQTASLTTTDNSKTEDFGLMLVLQTT